MKMAGAPQTRPPARQQERELPMQGKSLPQTRRAVLGLLCHEHPRGLSSVDLRRDFGGDARQAIADLMEAGLVQRQGEYVRPTRAALSFYRLEFP
jgi:hypothetical protein